MTEQNETQFSSEQAKDLISQAPAPAPEPLQFTRVTEFTTFEAEYALERDSLIFHFFVTDEVNKLKAPNEYWLKAFPTQLELTAITVFDAKFPRLRAAYTEEQASWWMRFDGCQSLDVEGLVKKFFEALDSSLEDAIKNM